MGPQKALETIGANLQKQYENWQPRVGVLCPSRRSGPRASCVCGRGASLLHQHQPAPALVRLGGLAAGVPWASARCARLAASRPESCWDIFVCLFNLDSSDWIVFLRCSEVFHAEFVVSSVVTMCLGSSGSNRVSQRSPVLVYPLEQMHVVQLVAEEGFRFCCKTLFQSFVTAILAKV